MSNFERLKERTAEMSEQEFINFIPFGFELVCGLVPKCRRKESGQPTNCNDCLVDWLKSEAEEDEP